MAKLHHKSLGTTLHGVSLCSDEIWQFRGIQYGQVPGRFAKATLAQPKNITLECTSFGPRCPQVPVDFRQLLRIPEDVELEDVPEDEFRCLNLDVTMPARAENESDPIRPLPVFVWIHGGSQTVTFGDSASKLCDPTNLVHISVRNKQPILVVTLNYRLNIFAFGDGNGERNLALSDQRTALQFVEKHISDFGGDPNNITLAGESAGAVYVHAHMVMGAAIRQAVLQSGSLYLSPPLDETRADTVISRIKDDLMRNGSSGLQTASAAELVRAQADLGIMSLFLQMEPALENWQEKLGSAERIFIGDCEYESCIWRNGIESMKVESICSSFDLLGDDSASLKAMYGIIPGRQTSCRLGALDLIHDVRFTFATETIFEQWQREGRQAFRFLVDQANPWQPSSRAHHAVDLPLLFGSFDLGFNPSAEKVSSLMSQKWIDFIIGSDPWTPGGYFAFGPLGESMIIDEDGYKARRRMKHCKAIEAIGIERVDQVFVALAAGNISLNN